MGSFAVRSARLLDTDGLVDIEVADGVVVGVVPASGPAVGDDLDAAGGLVLPSFVEAHFHADKALTFPRVGPVATSSLDQALATGARIKAGFTEDDVVERATRAMETAVLMGVGAMRVQIDIDSAVGLRGFTALRRVQDAFAERIDLQLVAFPQEGVVRDPAAVPMLREALESGATVLGGGPENEGAEDRWAEHLDILFGLAREYDVPLDLHADMAEDPGLHVLELIAEQTIAHGWEGRVSAVHCCALSSYSDDVAARTIAKVRDAGMQICICPVGNLHVMGGDLNPRGRGASRPKELLAAGVNVAAGTDNLSDMWFRFGSLDPLQNALLACLSGGLRTDAEVRDGLDMVGARAARYLGLEEYGIVVGHRADLVVTSAQSVEDLLRGVPGRRLTIKDGTLVGRLETTAWVGGAE